MPPKDPELVSLRKELEDLIAKCQQDQKSKQDKTIEEVSNGMADVPKCKLATKKMLKGHINKVNSVHYSGDSRHAVSGSLDGKLIIWDTWTGNKIQVIPLRSAWVMSVAFAPTGNYVACGGMDNMCTVYDLNNRDSNGGAKMVRELLGYEGFLSSCRFVDDKTLITGSGDMKLCMWDLEAGKRTNEVAGAHCGDVVSLSLAPDQSTFVTGSVDKTCKLWDLKELKCKQMFFGHEADVNSVCSYPLCNNKCIDITHRADILDHEQVLHSVQVHTPSSLSKMSARYVMGVVFTYHNSGYGFATASEDKSARLYDVRSDQQVAMYKPPNSTSGFTSCGLSVSGRFLLAGSDDNSIHVWDTMKVEHNGFLNGHENRVTSLSVSPSGMSVVTSSWDTNVRVWV